MTCPFQHGQPDNAAATGTADSRTPVVAEQSTPGPEQIIASESQVDPLLFLGQLIDQYGDVVRYRTRFGPCFLFVHPEHVQTVLHRENYRRASLVKMMLGDGLLAIDGPRWRSQRRLMQRDFMPASVEPFISLMNAETSRAAATWATAAAKQEVVDVTALMTQLTLRIVVEALFSDDMPDAQSNELCAAVTQTINDLGRISWAIFGAPVVFTPGTNAAYAAGKKVIDTLCYEMITRRRGKAPEERPDDLLTMLIEAETDAGPMTDRQLRDEIVTMLVGGHETTALALGWAWKAIAENPEIESRLHREIDHVLCGRVPVLEDLSKLPWTRSVFQEAMRLYPPVWYMARVANEDDVVHGHKIPRGASVLISAWFTHRHKDFWKAPDTFDPTRFLDPATPSHRYAYFPFGGGRHQCLGMHFSLLEGPLILAQLAQQFRVLPVDGQQILPDPGITLRQKPALMAHVKWRQPAAVVPASESEVR